MAPSSSYPPMKYQVFLSFRGEDTRHNFTSHLREALKKTGMSVFFDEDALEKGELLSPALSQGIADSRLSIIVLSKDYASSKSCLAELSEIMHRKETQGHIALPIFYHVDPSDVRHLGGPFDESFKNHHESESLPVQRWKAALAEVGKLKGWHIKGDKSDRSDTEYIEAVVDYVIKKLNSKSSSVSEDLVGIDDPKKVVLALVEQEESRVIGIWGESGTGKTTLTEAVYNEISPKFPSHYFLYNVRQEIKIKGITSVRNVLLSELLNSKTKVATPTVRDEFIQERLNNTRALVVLDDVDDADQIDSMGVNNLGYGSRIILTSKYREVLKNAGAGNNIHEVKKLNTEDSLQLFCTFAFKQFHPAAEFLDLSRKFVNYADGNPLILRKSGSRQYGKPRGEWEKELALMRSFDEHQGAMNCTCIDRSRNIVLVQLPLIPYVASLELLILHGCTNLKKISDLSGAVNLKILNCSECTSLLELPCLNDLESLELLLLQGCKRLDKIPDLSRATNLKLINFCGCTSLLELPCLYDLTFLEQILLNGCMKLRNIPDLSGAINLRMIDCCGCTSLAQLPSLKDLESLESLLLNGCVKLTDIPGLSGAINLKKIDINGCKRLVGHPCFNGLPFLETLQIFS